MGTAAEIVEHKKITLNTASEHSFARINQYYIYLGNTNILELLKRITWLWPERSEC